MTSAMFSIVKKDIRSVASDKQLFSTIWIVPLILTVVLPSIFVLILHYVPEEMAELEELIKLLPLKEQVEDMNYVLLNLIVNYMMPIFFMMVPIVSSSVMAAGSFVGEKEKHTLETLLYCPLSLKQIFRAKIFASFFLSMIVSVVSFICMSVVVECEIYGINGFFLVPDISWGVILFLISPSISLITITLIVRNSAKAKSVEAAQQSSVYLILPVIALLIGEFAGIILINVWILVILGVLLLVIAITLMNNVKKILNYERILEN